jgi:hypothetical protein
MHKWGASTLIAFSVGAVALSGIASAEVKAVEPRMMIVTKDGAALRCDTGNIYYPVRVLKTGDLIKVDGEGGGWVRAEYPAGTRAYVRADEANFDAAAKTVRLIKATKLMAANDGNARPWWPLMEKDIAAGTAFSPAEMVRAADGATEGYLFPAPAGAHGYVKAEQVRNATPAELAAKSDTPAAPVPATNKPESKPMEIAVKPAEPKPVETKPADVKPVESKPIVAETKPMEAKPADIKPAEPKPTEITMKPVDRPTAALPPAAPQQVAPPTQEIVEVKPAEVQATTIARPPTRTPAPTSVTKPEVTRRIDDIGLLRELFDRAMQPESDGAEITTVISEFNRKIDTLPMSGEDGKVRMALSQRLDALTMRKEVADARMTLRDTTQIDSRLQQVKLAVENAQKQAIYAIVGRMLPSTVYDGKRGMPLMYRVESADFSSTRTIGYVVTREGMDLLPVMGKIVGIVGESKMDPALGLNLVMPVRVDEMRVTGDKMEVIPNAITMPTGSTPPGAAPMLGPISRPLDPSAIPAPPTEPKGEPVASPTPDTTDINK